MHIAIKSTGLGVLMSIAGTVGAVAQTSYSAPYPMPPETTTTLPGVVGQGRANTAPHYRVPAGYDSDVELHPYTSGLGPCAENAAPSQGCHHPTGNPIPPSHYERPPFTR